MGGEGSGRTPGVGTLVKRNTPEVTPVGNGIFLPNYSGVQNAALKTSAPLGTGGAESDPIWGSQSGAYLKKVDESWPSQSGAYLKIEDESWPAQSGAYLTIANHEVLSGAYYTHAADASDPHGTILSQTGIISSGTISGANLIATTSATLAGMKITNDGTKTTLLGTEGDYVRIGDASTNTSCSENDDLFVSGKFQTQGVAIFNGGFLMIDDVSIGLGNDNDARIKFSSDQLADCLLYSLDDVSKTLIFGTIANRNKNFDHSAQANPTLYIQSAIDPDTNNTQWLSLAHNQTDGVLMTGKGHVQIASASGALMILNKTSAINTPTGGGCIFISGGALWFKGSSGTETSIAAA